MVPLQIKFLKIFVQHLLKWKAELYVEMGEEDGKKKDLFLVCCSKPLSTKILSTNLSTSQNTTLLVNSLGKCNFLHLLIVL